MDGRHGKRKLCKSRRTVTGLMHIPLRTTGQADAGMCADRRAVFDMRNRRPELYHPPVGAAGSSGEIYIPFVVLERKSLGGNRIDGDSVEQR